LSDKVLKSYESNPRLETFSSGFTIYLIEIIADSPPLAYSTFVLYLQKKRDHTDGAYLPVLGDCLVDAMMACELV